jgi:hypothetical protein
LMIIEIKCGLQVWSQCIPGRPLLAPIYRWQVSRNRSGSIQISLYKTNCNTTSYFNYDYSSIFILGLSFVN